MAKKGNKNNGAAAFARRAAATRRLGNERKCSRCGEDQPFALIQDSSPRICDECRRKEAGMSIYDDHHPGSQNNFSFTVPVPANDHRGRLSVAQYEWPSRTLRNPDRSPLLAAAAGIRGFIDFQEYCADELLRAEMLEKLDAQLTELLGPRWWEQASNKPNAQENSK